MAEVKKPKVKRHSGGVELDFSNQQTPWDQVPLSQPTPQAQAFQSPDYQPEFNVTAAPQPITAQEDNIYGDVDPNAYPERGPAGLLNAFANYTGVGPKNKPIDKDMTVKPKSPGELDAANAAGQIPMLWEQPISASDPDIEEQFKSLLNESRGKIGQSEDQLDFLRAQPAQTDLSGLMALADTWGKGGGAYSKAYKAPNTPEEMVITQQKLEDFIQKQREGLMENLAKQQYQRSMRQASDPDGKFARQKYSRVQAIMKDTTTQVGKIGKQWDDILTTITPIQEAIQSGNYRRITELIPRYASAIGGTKGTQSDRDVQAATGMSLSQIQTQLSSLFDPKSNFDSAELQSKRANLAAALGSVKEAYRKGLSRVYSTTMQSLRTAGAPEYAVRGGPIDQMLRDEYRKARDPEWWEKISNPKIKEGLLARIDKGLAPDEAIYMIEKPGSKGKAKSYAILKDSEKSNHKIIKRLATPTEAGTMEEEFMKGLSEAPEPMPKQQANPFMRGRVPGYPAPVPLNTQIPGMERPMTPEEYKALEDKARGR